MKILASTMLMALIAISLTLPAALPAASARVVAPSPIFTFSGYHDFPDGSYEFLAVAFNGTGDPLTFSSLGFISIYWHEHTSHGIYQMEFGPYSVSGGQLFESMSFPTGSGQINIGTTMPEVTVKGALTGFNPAMSTKAVIAGTVHVDDDARTIVSGGLVVLLTGTVYFDSNTELGISTAHWNPQGTMTRMWLLSPQTLSTWDSYSIFTTWTSVD